MLPVLIFLMFAITSSAQSSFNPLPDMGLAQILPLPGKFGGYVVGTDKDPVMITLLAGEDSTRKTLPAATPEPPKRSGDIGVAFSEGRVLGVAVGDVPVSVKFIDLGDKDYRLLPDLPAALEAGRVVRLGSGYLRISVVDAKTKQIAKRLRYTFSDQSTIAWDTQKRSLIWRGFSVKVE
jgi:hypothetical protein